MLTLALVSLAHAHPAAVPHVHETDPAALAIVAFWLLAAVGLSAASRYGWGRGAVRAS